MNDAMKRLEMLQQRSMDVKESLEDSLVYHEFVKDIHDALLWEREKFALVSSGDFGKSLVEVPKANHEHWADNRKLALPVAGPESVRIGRRRCCAAGWQM